MYNNLPIPYVIAVDFDMTIAVTDFPKIISPKLSVINKLKEKQSEGAKLILWTCRGGKDLEEAIEFCKTYDLIFDKVNENLESWNEYFGHDSRKIGANEYWDDKAVKIY